MSNCPPEERLVQFAEQRLPESEAQAVEQHVQSCSSCSLIATMLRPAPGAPAALSQTEPASALRPAEAVGAPDEPAEELSPGQKIDGYVVVRKLGEGGMGVVYEALHEQIMRRAALKIMRRSVLLGLQASRRFLTEARAANTVQHPSIVSVFHMGQLASGSPYIVMEYLQGQTLRERLRECGRLPWSLATALGQQIADAMAAAHEQGVVHRDLKPDNIMIIRDPAAVGGERVKILDFGLAKLDHGAPAGSRQTQSGAILGTPLYIAPEQIGGSSGALPTSDVYALGIILFELMAGRPPFVAARVNQVYAMHLKDEPAELAALVEEIPAELSALVRTMLTKQPEERPGMRQVADILLRHGALWSSSAGRLPVVRARRTRARQFLVRSALAVAAAAALSAAALWLIRSKRQEPRMISYAGGTFTMGSTPEEVDAAFAWCKRLAGDGCQRERFERELPAHQVQLAPFFLDETEVTTERFVGWLNMQKDVRVIEQRMVLRGQTMLLDLYPTFGHFGARWTGRTFQTVRGYERKPITQVTWDGAAAYCKEQGWRLPTEAEWEYAARGAQGFRFPWGWEEPTCEGVVFARLPSYACGYLHTTLSDVAASAQDRSPQGIHDLAGNVSEWVADRYRERYSACAGGCTNPLVDEPEAGKEDELRIVRGGDWYVAAPSSRAAWRGRLPHDKATGNVGFRCARSAPR